MYGKFLLIAVLLSAPVFAQELADLPDKNITPGEIDTTLTQDEICTRKWGKDVREVTEAMKKEVIEAYHFDVNSCPLTKYRGEMVRRLEIDHLVPRELGGKDSLKNLWPQCYEPVLKDKEQQANGAHKKDQLENKMHKLVCVSGQVNLTDAQQMFMDNWLNAYHRYILKNEEQTEDTEAGNTQ